MRVLITQQIYAALPILAKLPFQMKEIHKYQTDKKLNLDKFKVEDLEKLVKQTAKAPNDIKGMANLHRDIQHWIYLSKNQGAIKENKIKARRVEHAYTLLIKLLKGTEKKHLYSRLEGSAEGIVLSYYVNGIEYEPPGRDHSEYVKIKLLYQEFGKIYSHTEHLYAKDCLRLSPVEILMGQGYMLETPGLREDYEFYLETFNKIHGNIGEQYLAVGIADDEGIDGNEKEDDHWWYSSRHTKLRLDREGEPTKVVIDIFQEEDKEENRHNREVEPNQYFWSHQTELEDDQETEVNEEDVVDEIEIPHHPYVASFDLKHHKRLRIHVGNLTKYEYDTKIRKKLILPKACAKLIDVLLTQQNEHFVDIIKGKTGGMVILCQGPPGTGKTLTAEVYAENLQRALYTVQCSQLGTDEETLESNLMKVLARGRRWGAVMLLDEADVYVHQRGNDLQQNAIVGVFLRVLEYHAGVLFLTTNRGDLVDDAILSRCTARIPYTNPSKDDQEQIWHVLAKTNKIELSIKVVQSIVKKHNLSGRDIKNLLKLASLVAQDRDCEIDEPLIAEMKTFKPTFTEE